MAITKITLNELRGLIKKIINEETNKSKINLNEGKINGGAFEDYDFKYKGDNLSELIITYKYRPSESLIKKDLQLIKNNFREGSVYNMFEPRLGIIYPFVYGWDTGFNAYLTINENSEYENRPFFDEPSGKYEKKGRKIFKL